MDIETPKDIVIVGGSICGLMHGIILKRLGHNVHILEQSSTSLRPALAAGITAGPYFQEFMKKHDRCQEPYSLPSAVQFINATASVTRKFNVPLKMTSWDVLYYRLRANFDGFTSDHCPRSYVDEDNEGNAFFDLGKKVTGVQSRADGKEGLEVAFDDLIDPSKGSSIFADYVLAADGASSSIRQQLIPEPHRPYSGYVAWRGTVPEEDVSPETVSLLDRHFSAFVMKKSYMVSYVIPGSKGSLRPGSRLVNYLWYFNVAENSPEFARIMTDTDAHRHRHTLPVGKMQPAVWEQQKAAGRQMNLPAPYQELMAKTAYPFISAIRDTAPRGALFLNKRLFLVGDAHALFRPHIGASTNQAALHALELEKAFRGEITIDEWEAAVTAYGKRARALSVALGTFFQSGWLATLPWLLTVVGLFIQETIMRRIKWVQGFWVEKKDRKEHKA